MVGQRIKELRKARNMTQTELCEKCGITRTSLWKIESGDVPNMSAHTAIALADALGVSVDFLLCGERLAQ